MFRKDAPFLHIDSPYTLHLAQELFAKEMVDELYDTAPIDRTALISRTDAQHEKQYRMNLFYLMVNGRRSKKSAQLPAPWQALLDTLTGDEFTTWLSEGTGIQLHGLSQDIGVYTHVEGDFVSVHKDKLDKAITSILYLNPQWPVNAGGDFEVHFSGEPDDDRTVRLAPRPGQLLAFPPTEDSWHAVSRIAPGNDTVRLTLQLEYWFDHEDRYGID